MSNLYIIMNSPDAITNKRKRNNDSPRIQRSYEDKKAIIDYYNTIKDKYGSKSETVKKFYIKYVSVLDKILIKENEINTLIDKKPIKNA